MASHEERVQLRPAMGFVDLLLFFIMTGFSIRWIAAAAAAGPSSIIIWVVALAAFYIPLVFCVLELSSRYPDEGGLYVWSKHAFGEFAGFMTGWTYWSSNSFISRAILYFAAGNASLYWRRSLAESFGQWELFCHQLSGRTRLGHSPKRHWPGCREMASQCRRCLPVGAGLDPHPSWDL